MQDATYQGLSGFECEGVQERQARNPFEVVDVAGDEGEAVHACSSGDQRVAEGHLAKLPEFDRLLQNIL